MPKCTFGHGDVAAANSSDLGPMLGSKGQNCLNFHVVTFYFLLPALVPTGDGADEPTQGQETVAKMSHLCKGSLNQTDRREKKFHDFTASSPKGYVLTVYAYYPQFLITKLILYTPAFKHQHPCVAVVAIVTF